MLSNLVLSQCQAFDAIGSVGFGKEFNAAADLQGEGAKACHAVEQGRLVLDPFLLCTSNPTESSGCLGT